MNREYAYPLIAFHRIRQEILEQGYLNLAKGLSQIDSTCLFLATHSGHFRLVRYFFPRIPRINPNIIRTEGLYLDIVRFYSDHLPTISPSDINTLITTSLRYGHLDILKYLLHREYRFNILSFNAAFYGKSLWALRLVIQNLSSLPCLDTNIAVLSRGTQRFQLAIRAGAPFDPKLLYLSVMFSFNLVQTLLVYGADPNIVIDHNSPLNLAVRYGKVKTAQLLLNYGADIHFQDDQPLFLAVENQNLPLIRLLLDRGANPNAQHGTLYSIPTTEESLQNLPLPREIESLFTLRDTDPQMALNLSVGQSENIFWMILNRIPPGRLSSGKEDILIRASHYDYQPELIEALRSKYI